MSESLHRLADAYGIEPGYVAESGAWHDTSDDTRRALLAAMGVPAHSHEDIARALAEAPTPMPSTVSVAMRAYRPDWLDNTRVWGFACQLYGLRSARNWGMGDFEDLARLAELTAPLGADFLGVNPLHALFPADPSRFSPYAPSSRQFLNTLYIAPDRLPEFVQVADAVAGAMAECAGLRAMTLIDYPAVARAKGAAFEALHAAFVHLPPDSDRARAFAEFRHSGGPALRAHCLYDALAEHFMSEGGLVAWSQWPAPFRDIHSREVADFAARYENRIDYYMWLQWVADTQLAEVQRRARAAGMRLGLYLDMAVGVAPDGAATWVEPQVAIASAEIGSPPDPFNTAGQQWGLAPLCPAQLQKCDLAPFRVSLAATMRHAGAVRIDHAMGLQRLFWIPQGMTAADGAYVRYPLARMFEAVAEASRATRCLAIGEDLGTVPPGFRDTMSDAGLFAYRVLYFERTDDDRFRPIWDHGTDALICASTHDLPTLKGWWSGRDIAWRRDLELFTREESDRQFWQRGEDRARLLDALEQEGLRPHNATPDGPFDAMLSMAVHRFLARTPCRLLAVQLDDVLGAEEQVNLPGTVDDHPNWRRKAPAALEDLDDHRPFGALAAALAEERPRT